MSRLQRVPFVDSHTGREPTRVILAGGPNLGRGTAVLHPDGSVSVNNVPSYRKARAVAVEGPQGRKIVGDVAYGGNWFFLISEGNHDLALERANIDSLTSFAGQLRRTINAQGFPE